MALSAYLTLKGATQGDIKGGVTEKGRVGSILVRAASHAILRPTDPESGLFTGKTHHEPYVVTKEVDRTTPMLYQAMLDNENISEWALRFWRAGPEGTETQHYLVTLTDASIASIRFRLPDNRTPDLARLGEYEEIAFAYQDIQWVWGQAGITSTDDSEAGDV